MRARINGFEKPAVGIAEIGDRIERDVGHSLAEYNVKEKQVTIGDRGYPIAFAKVSTDCTAIAIQTRHCRSRRRRR